MEFGFVHCPLVVTCGNCIYLFYILNYIMQFSKPTGLNAECTWMKISVFLTFFEMINSWIDVVCDKLFLFRGRENFRLNGKNLQNRHTPRFIFILLVCLREVTCLLSLFNIHNSQEAGFTALLLILSTLSYIKLTTEHKAWPLPLAGVQLLV